MSIRIHSIALSGIQGEIVHIEAEQFNSLPGILIVGLGDTAIQESKERLRAALKNSGEKLPSKKITINLAPAHLPKRGSHFDLAIALALTTLTNKTNISSLSDTIILGELALNGELRPLKEVLPLVIAAKKKGYKKFLLPSSCRDLLKGVDGLYFSFQNSLKDVLETLQDEGQLIFEKSKTFKATELQDFENKVLFFYPEQMMALRCLEIAALGMHHLAFVGPPGVGKSFLAQLLPALMPPLCSDESLEVMQIHSLSPVCQPVFSSKAPFRSIHHSITPQALVGGGKKLHPGEISLAHNGVLFIDEMAEFDKKTLDLLRQPLEDNTISISRVHGRAQYPARFLLVGALNPCPCGYAMSNHHFHQCSCKPSQINRYQNRISGPLLDRIDIKCFLKSPRISTKNPNNRVELSEIRKKILSAYAFRKKREAKKTNQKILRLSSLPNSLREMIEKAIETYGMSIRSIHKTLHLSRTIADLELHDDISPRHIGEALQYRNRFQFTAS